METSLLLKVCESVLPNLHEIYVSPPDYRFTVDGMEYPPLHPDVASVLYLQGVSYVIHAETIRPLRLWLLNNVFRKHNLPEAWMPIIISSNCIQSECLLHLILDVDNSSRTRIHLVCSTDSKPFTENVAFVVPDRKARTLSVFSGENMLQKTIPPLSEDELKCIRMSEAGMTIVEISDSLNWSDSKTKRVKVNLYRKLGVKDMVQAITVLRMFNLR